MFWEIKIEHFGFENYVILFGCIFSKTIKTPMNVL